MAQWFVIQGGKEQGPFNGQQLKEMAATGRLRPADLVRREDMKGPTKASAIKGLFPANAAPSPSSANPARSNKGATSKFDKSAPVEDLRRRLTSFADKIPHHGIKNLGDSISVLAASRLSIFRIEWTTLFEQREVAQRERPHDGSGAIPRRGFDARTFDVWAQPLPHATAFEKSTAEVPLEATQQVRDCGQCGAAGAVTCDACNGQRQVSCATCKGSGVQACGGCSGTGKTIETYTERRQQHCRGPILAGVPSRCNGGYDIHGRVCSNCNGSGVEWYNHTGMRQAPCSACGAGGRVRCASCNATGIVACPRCQGHGRLTCPACSGHGKIVHYLAAMRSLEPQSSAVVVPAKGCPQECVETLDGKADFKETLQKANLEGELNTAFGDGMERLNDEVHVLRDGLRTQVNDGRRLAGERLRVERASVYRLDYSLNGKAFTAWFSGEDGPVHAPINPLTDSVSQLVEAAVAAWAEGRQKEGEWTLRKALGMAKASPDCARALEPLKPSIPEALLRRASSFSLRFWFEHLSPMVKVLVGVPAGCLSLCVLGFCLLCVLAIIIGPPTQKATTGTGVSAEKQQPGSSSREQAGNGLTGQFLPFVPGNVKRYEEEVYNAVNGQTLVSSEDQETYGKDNTLTVERTIKSPGMPPSQVSYRGERREENGYVELAYIDSHQNKVLSMRVKIGANPGDEWSDADKGTYRLIRFDKTVAQGAKGPHELLQAVVEHRLVAVDREGVESVIVTEIVLEREDGVQSEKAYMIREGEKKLIRHRRLISSTN